MSNDSYTLNDSYVQWKLDGFVHPSTNTFTLFPTLLTPSLPWCHLKTTSKSAKCETFNCFCLLFLHCHVKGFSWKHTALKVDVTGTGNTLFAGASRYLSAREVYRLGQGRVNIQHDILLLWRKVYLYIYIKSALCEIKITTLLLI